MSKVIEERRASVLQQQNTDHDLLIELRTEMRGVRDDIQKLTDGTAQRLNTLENDHVSRKEYEDHETRIRFIEKYVWGAVAVIGILNFIGLGGIILLATKLLN